MRALGMDLAWGLGSATRPARETGVVALDPDGSVVDAGWTVGLAEAVAWVGRWATADTLLFVDASLVVDNLTGQRLCERQVGQRYGRWKVSANSTNLATPALAGVALLRELVGAGWGYHAGHGGPPVAGRWVSECYPYTTLVGAAELGYRLARPAYKRRPSGLGAPDWPVARARACDELIGRVAALARADPPLLLDSHPDTARLRDPSPLEHRPYKHREDLLDAVLCAWTAAFWLRHGLARAQVLGADPRADGGPVGTIIAPTRPEQRGSGGGSVDLP
ncbi:MAG: DUF429 domain-containing protein [Mycobacteriales bacterium]